MKTKYLHLNRIFDFWHVTYIVSSISHSNILDHIDHLQLTFQREILQILSKTTLDELTVTAILSFSFVNSQTGTTHCLCFSYHMYGGTVGTLSVYLNNKITGDSTPLWSLSGNQGNEWHDQALAITTLDSNSQVKHFFIFFY